MGFTMLSPIFAHLSGQTWSKLVKTAILRQRDTTKLAISHFLVNFRNGTKYFQNQDDYSFQKSIGFDRLSPIFPHLSGLASFTGQADPPIPLLFHRKGKHLLCGIWFNWYFKFRQSSFVNTTVPLCLIGSRCPMPESFLFIPLGRSLLAESPPHWSLPRLLRNYFVKKSNFLVAYPKRQVQLLVYTVMRISFCPS